MSAKSSTISITLPVIQLNPRVVYLPGITYRTSFERDHGLSMLARFSKHLENIESSESKLSNNQKKILREAFKKYQDDEKVKVLSSDSLQGTELFQSKFSQDRNTNNKDKWMLMGCLPGYDMSNEPAKPVTICQIADIMDVGEQLIISFNAISRGVLKPAKEDDVNESTIEVVLPSELMKITKGIDTQVQSLLEDIERLFANIKEFVDLYDNALEFSGALTASKSSEYVKTDEKLRYVLLTLIPIASLLFTNLSSNESMTGFARLEKLYKSFKETYSSKKSKPNDIKLQNFNGFLTLNDILCSLFPFSISQKISLLNKVDPMDRLTTVSENVEFANKIFEQTLNLDYLVDSWNDLDTKLGKLNGDYKRSQFISRHLRSLRVLMESVSSSRKSSANSASRSSRRPPGRGSIRAEDEEDSEEDDDLRDITKFIKNIDNLVFPEDGKKLVLKDYKRMKSMQPSSSDYQLLRSYLEIVIDIPWISLDSSNNKNDFKGINLDQAKAQLDSDHYGMESVKERILEYIAVLQLHDRINESLNGNIVPDADSASVEKENNDADSSFVISEDSVNDHRKQIVKRNPKTPTEKPKAKVPDKSVAKAPILLLSGPPGVGKTSLAKSIATTLGREFQRISLGGLRDESEIKGHRRTYIGAMPGLIIQALRRSQVMNPVILLDEIDKVVTGGSGASGRSTGDPGAALLEVLDPEQNVNFHDHYIGFPVDLSQVVFICTANDVWELSDPLRDRMEVIELNGYNYFEKVEICKRYLIPRQIKRNGLPVGKNSVVIPDDVILKIATSYTHESGIRTLERLISSICRSKAIEFSRLLNNNDSIKELPSSYNPIVSLKDLSKYIGVPHKLTKNVKSQTLISTKYGVVNGLSYNSDGSGSTLVFEMIGTPGSSGISCTGRLGEVLMESCQIANSLVGSILNNNFIGESEEEHTRLLERYNNLSVHMHVPQGAVSKDGPSAGITMTLCLLSLILEKPVDETIAMTGEITLRGLVLPIGGVKEKLLGAHLTGKIKKVLLPRANRKDIVSDFIENIEGKDKETTDELLASLIGKEEELLNLPYSTDASSENRSKRLHVFDEPEIWVKEKFGIEIVYVEEFTDVIEAVWGNDIITNKTSDRIHEIMGKERSHL